jgi:hypothetical protein
MQTDPFWALAIVATLPSSFSSQNSRKDVHSLRPHILPVGSGHMHHRFDARALVGTAISIAPKAHVRISAVGASFLNRLSTEPLRSAAVSLLAEREHDGFSDEFNLRRGGMARHGSLARERGGLHELPRRPRRP